MRGENTADRVRLKAIMWELVILRLIRCNGFKEILSVDDVRTRRQREQFFEMRGRGCWHQIDCPCDYDKFIAFINPIRLIGEVKFYANPVTKDHIRQFVGVLKDIQENYFTSEFDDAPSERFTEIGTFFSSSGFDAEAEKLAFAHNIKTISYKNVWLLESLKKAIENIEINYLKATECVSAGKQSSFVRAFKAILDGNAAALNEFDRSYRPADGFASVLRQLMSGLQAIRSSFVGTTSGGAFLHFIGDSEFPEDLFFDTDTQPTRVYYFQNRNRRFFFLEFARDRQRRRYYFNPPLALAQAAFYSQKEAIYQKSIIFSSVHVTRNIAGLSRNLMLKLDQDWLNQVEAGIR